MGVNAGFHALTQSVGPTLRCILRLFYPLHCAVCRIPLERGLLCYSCEDALRPLPGFHCLQCGAVVTGNRSFCRDCRAGKSAVDRGVCYGLYEEGKPLAVLIQSLKYHGDRALAAYLGSRLLAATTKLAKPEAITFVPLRRKRQRQRGFNQAQLLAQFVGGAWQLPVLPLLKKTRDTSPQASLKRRRRIHNLDGAFVAKPNAFKTVWLVDDIRTTGTTLEVCAKALKVVGIGRVETLVLAVAPLN